MADDLDLMLYEDGEPDRTPPVPAPTIDVTIGLTAGPVIRVAAVGTDLLLTVAGPDGMVTLTMSPNEWHVVGSAGETAASAARANQAGRAW